jgi:hypothetical protein
MRWFWVSAEMVFVLRIEGDDVRTRRLQAAIEAGADPAAQIDPLDRAQERVMAARLERDQVPSSQSLGRAEVEAMLDYVGDVGAALKRATPEKLAELSPVSASTSRVCSPSSPARCRCGRSAGRGPRRPSDA